MNNFTEDQLRIINDMGKNMIVSASAGSGKTTVMIERIVKLMVENEVPISKFLIVTFTKASSSDMKNKLLKKLSEKQPTPFILQQIDDVPISDISNLHSFCARTLKSYFYEVGIDPAFVVLDEIEASAIKERAMDILIREQYEENDEFYDLIDIFSKNRKDYKLRELILKLDSFLSAESEPEKWFKKGLASYNEDLSKNPSALLLNDYIIKSTLALLSECNELIVYLNEYKNSKLIEFVQKIQTNLSKVNPKVDFVRNSQAISSFEKLGNIPNVLFDEEELKERVKSFRDKYTSIVTHLKGVAIDDKEELINNLTKTKKRVDNLYKVTCRFKEIYSNLKKEKGGLDFNDLEEYTFKVLENPDILQALKNKYEYIFVDEYQDINGMQEKIIALLSRDNNRFMVGDVKQSIYRFRLCDPQIFIDKYKDYSYDSKNSKVYDLNDNFRSHKDILNFCNYIFNKTMTDKFGGLNYKDKQMKSGLGEWDNKKENANINLIYINTHKENNDQNEVVNNVYSVEKHKNAIAEEEKSAVAEAVIVAKNIGDLLLHAKVYDVATKKHRKIEYKDIVILTASRSESLREFIETLQNYDIPVSADLLSDALDDEFVSGINNLLQLISNSTHDDILFKVLYSPLFNFTASELASIRNDAENKSFSENVFDNVKNNTKVYEKIQNFIEKLQKYKNLSAYKTVPELLSIIERDLDLVAKIYASDGFEESIAKYNKFKNTLPNLLLNDYLQEQVTTLPIESTMQSNAVKIMTIHKSKGLEFPVVFMIGMGRNFNFKSLYGDCLLSKDLGIGMSYFDEQARYKTDTIAIKAARISEKENLLEEQQRLLYVGMTRAINFLYIIGSRDEQKLHTEFENPNCFLDWFTPALHFQDCDKLNVEEHELSDVYNYKPQGKINELILNQPNVDIINALSEQFNKKYDYDMATKMPVKSSFTALTKNQDEHYAVRSHIGVDKAVLIGNAYHKLLQHISFAGAGVDHVENEIARLIEEGRLTEDEKILINPTDISNILEMPVFKDINKNNYTILREREFYYNMPADKIYDASTNEEILIQGIIDLLVIKENSFDIIDYKTSRLDDEAIVKKYKNQLIIYANAMEKALNKPLGQAIVISLLDNKSIKII